MSNDTSQRKTHRRQGKRPSAREIPLHPPVVLNPVVGAYHGGMPPLVLSTWSFGRIANDAAMGVLNSGGRAEEAALAGLAAVESDPRVDSVGRGGLPNAAGIVELDAALMASPSRWASVCGIRSTGRPSAVLPHLLEDFDRALRVGEGADAYLAHKGVPVEPVWSDGNRKFWSAFGARIPSPYSPHRFRIPFSDNEEGSLFPVDEQRWSHHDTVGVLVIDNSQCCVAATSTSGTPLKPPGRVGDSPIVGHGLYCLPGIGAAVATGTGELISSVCLCFDTVRRLADGYSPMEATKTALAELSRQLSPSDTDQVGLICVSAGGHIGAAALRPGFRLVVSTRTSCEVRNPDYVVHRAIDE